jgi:hypothetical protein
MATRKHGFMMKKGVWSQSILTRVLKQLDGIVAAARNMQQSNIMAMRSA